MGHVHHGHALLSCLYLSVMFEYTLCTPDPISCDQ